MSLEILIGQIGILVFALVLVALRLTLGRGNPND